MKDKDLKVKIRDSYPINTFQGITQDELVEYILGLFSQIEEEIKGLQKYFPTGNAYIREDERDGYLLKREEVLVILDKYKEGE